MMYSVTSIHVYHFVGVKALNTLVKRTSLHSIVTKNGTNKYHQVFMVRVSSLKYRYL